MWIEFEMGVFDVCIIMPWYNSFKFERCIILFIHEGERGLSRGKRMDRTAFYY